MYENQFTGTRESRARIADVRQVGERAVTDDRRQGFSDGHLVTLHHGLSWFAPLGLFGLVSLSYSTRYVDFYWFTTRTNRS